MKETHCPFEVAFRLYTEPEEDMSGNSYSKSLEKLESNCYSRDNHDYHCCWPLNHKYYDEVWNWDEGTERYENLRCVGHHQEGGALN